MHRMDTHASWEFHFRKKLPTPITVEKFLTRGISTVLLGLPILVLRNIDYWRSYKESLFIKYGTELLLASRLHIRNKCKWWQISLDHILY